MTDQATPRRDWLGTLQRKNVLAGLMFMSVALLGVAIGAAAAFGLSRVIASFLFGVTARDPLVFTIVPALLTAVAFLGVWLPARRAANVDPVVALRAD